MRSLAFILALSTLACVAPAAHAVPQWGNSFTPDQARDARNNGDVKPLSEIFANLKRQYGGYQVNANLYNRGNRQEYVIDWMTGKGERVRFTVDAKSGRVLSKR